MRTITISLIILLFAGSISACNRYENYNNQKRTFYINQEHNPDLIGVWRDYDDEDRIDYTEYRSNGEVYYHHKYPTTNTINITTHPKEYWYSDNEYIYSLEIFSGLDPNYRKMHEWSNRYHLSENKDTLYLQNSSGTYSEYIRTETPVID